MSKENIVAFLMASTACFPVFRPYRYDSQYYLDGAFFDNLPIQTAIAQGYKNIIVVNLKSIGRRQYCRKDGCHIIQITRNYGQIGLLDFHSKKIEDTIRYGYYDTLKAMGEKEGEQYTFHAGVSNLLYNRTREFAVQAYGEIESISCFELMTLLEQAASKLNVSDKVIYTADQFLNICSKQFLKQQLKYANYKGDFWEMWKVGLAQHPQAVKKQIKNCPKPLRWMLYLLSSQMK